MTFFKLTCQEVATGFLSFISRNEFLEDPFSRAKASVKFNFLSDTARPTGVKQDHHSS